MPVFELILRRDRLVTGLSLMLVAGLSWAYILFGAVLAIWGVTVLAGVF